MVTTKTLASAMVKRLANRDITDAKVRELASKLAKDPRLLPAGVDICTLGICTDHFVPDHQSLKDLLDAINGSDFGGVRIFPIGIVAPDSFRVRLEHVIDRR